MKKIRLPKIKLNKHKVCKTTAAVSFLCLAASVFLQVAISNKFAVKGSEFLALKDQKESLEKENSLLKLKISEASSLAVVEDNAEELGFVEYNKSVGVIAPPQFASAR
jgi:hypothetical protein